MNGEPISYEPISYAALAGWAEDDHVAAFAAFLQSAARVLERAERAEREPSRLGRAPPSPELIVVCRRALEIGRHEAICEKSARSFFESNFTPHRVVHSGPPGLVTGYYEPRMAGSRVRTRHYAVPVYSRPHDLVNLIDESERGALAGRPTHARQTANGLIPYFTRQEIDQGALDGRGLELLYVADAVDLFFMQVQGSGLIEFDDGSSVRLTYSGKNGYDYTSIGRYLIETGQFAREDMTLQALIDWLKADPVRAREVMWKNKSYVFFEELGPASETSTKGVDGIPLSPGRSLAVDTAFHEIGTPIHVVSPSLTHVPSSASQAGPNGFNRLMIAQDVGSAIRGPERGDIFFGSGCEAGSIAGRTNHPALFIILKPQPAGSAEKPGAH